MLVTRLIELLQGFDEGATVRIVDGTTGQESTSFILTEEPNDDSIDGRPDLLITTPNCPFNCEYCTDGLEQCSECHRCGEKWAEANFTTSELARLRTQLEDAERRVGEMQKAIEKVKAGAKYLFSKDQKPNSIMGVKMEDYKRLTGLL